MGLWLRLRDTVACHSGCFCAMFFSLVRSTFQPPFAPLSFSVSRTQACGHVIPLALNVLPDTIFSPASSLPISSLPSSLLSSSLSVLLLFCSSKFQLRIKASALMSLSPQGSLSWVPRVAHVCLLGASSLPFQSMQRPVTVSYSVSLSFIRFYAPSW